MGGSNGGVGFFGCPVDAAQAKQTALFSKRSTCYDHDSVYFVAFSSPRQPEDFAAVRQVNIAAFERKGEADLVDLLRNIAPVLSFVAVQNGQIVGHLFFSPVSIETDCASIPKILGLAPLAVMPGFQKQGIGSLLVQHGLKECSRLGFSAVVVLGHPEYYPRFGFVPAQQKGLTCEYSVPAEAFMVVELQSEALKGCGGTVKYRPEFSSL